MILLYDASTTKWSEQMVLGVDSNSSGADGPVPMEIDRIEGKGKERVVQKESPKTRASQRENLEERAKGSMEKERIRKVVTRRDQRAEEPERDPRAKEKVTSSATCVVKQGILPRIVGSRFEMSPQMVDKDQRRRDRLCLQLVA